MADKLDFSHDEWEVLRDTPHVVVFAMTLAGASGFFGTIAEALAPSTVISAAMHGDNALLRAVCAQEEAQAAVSAIKTRARAVGDPADIREMLLRDAVAKAKAAVALLRGRDAHEDARAYANYLLTLAQRVAEAAKEGDFFGFGGERVSEHERRLLSELAEAVGAFQA